MNLSCCITQPRAIVLLICVLKDVNIFDRSLRRLKEEESKRSSDGSRFSEDSAASPALQPRRDFESEILALRRELMRTQSEAEDARYVFKFLRIPLEQLNFIIWKG